MKRLLTGWVCAVLALMWATVFSAYAEADGQVSFGVVSGADTANLREKPTKDSALLTSYPRDTWVEVVGESGNWYEVNAPDGFHGYMSKNYVIVAENTYGTIGVVTNPAGTSFLNLRATPSYTAKVLGIYYNETPCVLLSQSNGWYHVRVDGVDGYFREEYVRQAYRVFSEEVATVVTPGCTPLNLRSGPGKDYASISQYPGGQYVMVLQKGLGWWKVSVDGLVGFMSVEFLKDGVLTPSGVTATGAVQQTTDAGFVPDDQSYVIVNNPKSTQVLNLREAPDTTSQVLAQYSNGYALTLLGAGEEWCHVEDMNGQAGYMMTQFLKVYSVNAKPTLQVNHPQKSYVNLRQDASMAARVLEKVPHGATVTVLIPGSDWVKVRYGTQTGYMMAAFLGE